MRRPRACSRFLRGGAAPSDWRTEAHWEYDFRDAGFEDTLGLTLETCSLNVVRGVDTKYVHFADLPPLLFDLRNDPGELVDLAQDEHHQLRIGGLLAPPAVVAHATHRQDAEPPARDAADRIDGSQRTWSNGMSDLKGKVAFITGAGSGIGRGIAERLARDGADIFIADIDSDGAEMTANLVTQVGRRAVVTKANVAAKAQMQAAAAQCVAEFGRLDIAVANAGIGRGGSVLEMDLKDWNDQLDRGLFDIGSKARTVDQIVDLIGRPEDGGRVLSSMRSAAQE